MPLLVLLFPFQVQLAAAPPAAAATATVTIDDAVRSALAHHPDVAAAGAQTHVADAQARQARAPLLPQLDLTGRYSYTWSNPAERSTAVEQPDNSGVGGGAIEGGDFYSASASGSVLVWDFGQSHNRWRSARAAADATGQNAVAVRQAVVLEARLAFLSALETSELIQVARETLSNQQRHLAQTEEFVRIGTRPQIDLAKLRTDVETARAALIRAENDHRTAKARLNRAMGVSGSIDYQVAPAQLGAIAGEDQPTAALYAAAVGQRPELGAQLATIRSQEADVRATKAWFLPALRLGADAGYAGADFANPGLDATVGVTLNWTLFDGLGSAAAADASRAQLEVQKARLSGVEQQVWQEIEQARIAVASARAEIESADLGVKASRELLRLADERYAAGVGNSLELSDAELEVANAAAQRVRVEFDVASARAQLLSALGRRDWQ